MALVSNFRKEPQYLTKGTTIFLVEDLCDVNDELAVAEGYRVPGPEKSASSEHDVDPKLSSQQTQQLIELLGAFHDCFAEPFRVHQTTIAKRWIIMMMRTLFVKRNTGYFSVCFFVKEGSYSGAGTRNAQRRRRSGFEEPRGRPGGAGQEGRDIALLQ